MTTQTDRCRADEENNLSIQIARLILDLGNRWDRAVDSIVRRHDPGNRVSFHVGRTTYDAQPQP
jgi:hypothetical protein